jgi:hypothetical protein
LPSATGIVSPEEETETDAAVYDLMGRKIERHTQRGIYIKKGEKYIAR